MTRIWERLYIGSLADADGLAVANSSAVTTAICLSDVPVETRRRGINYLHLPIEDDEPVSVQEFDRIVDALVENIRWGTVLLHCSQGGSRAPSMAAAYMDAVGYKSIDAALNEIRRVRTFVSPSNILLGSLRRHLQ